MEDMQIQLQIQEAEAELKKIRSQLDQCGRQDARREQELHARSDECRAELERLKTAKAQKQLERDARECGLEIQRF